MRKTLLITVLLFIVSICFAQSDPIKFLGIPVDGSLAQFESKLMSKGFKYYSLNECYKGQFNGKSVDVIIHTNHDVVDRVVVLFPRTSEQSIRTEYNRLLKQFNDTGKYIGLLNEEIPEKEDISYEMTVNNKFYQCSFSYFDPTREPTAIADALTDKVLSKYISEEDVTKHKEWAKNVMNMPDDKQKDIFAGIVSDVTNGINDGSIDKEKAYAFIVSLVGAVEELADGQVWFKIDDTCSRIVLYYDNLHNQAHGEDL